MAWRQLSNSPVLSGALFIVFLPLLWPAFAVSLLCKGPYFDRLETRHPHPFKLLTGLGTVAWLVFLFSGGWG